VLNLNSLGVIENSYIKILTVYAVSSLLTVLILSKDIEMSKFKISLKFRSIFVIVFIVVSVVGLFFIAYHNADNLAKDLATYSVDLKLKADANSARKYLDSIHGKLSLVNGELRDSFGKPIAGNFEFVDTLHNELGVVATIFVHENDDFKRVSTNIIMENGQRAVGTMLGTANAVYASVHEGKKFFGEANILGKPYVTSYDPIRGETGEVIGIIFIGIPQSDINDLVSSYLKKFTLTFLGFAIATIITIAVILVLFSGYILSSLKKIKLLAENISRGDFTTRITVERHDEVGALVAVLNQSMDNLDTMISEIISAASNLTAAVDQISSGNQSLSQRTTEQASSLEEVAATIEQASAAINMNYDNSVTANKRSEQSFLLAQEGGAMVADAVASINQVNLSAKKIEEITSVINDIAFQTNLLALNAAVEAARAGEQGRGFAVVAGEVRNLAQRSATAAKEIAALIKDTVAKVDEGTEKANKSGDALKEIIQSVKNVGVAVSEITAASSEQKQGINQINVAITELDKMTQQNAALVEETAAASEEMAAQARELSAMMNKFTIKK